MLILFINIEPSVTLRKKQDSTLLSYFMFNSEPSAAVDLEC